MRRGTYTGETQGALPHESQWGFLSRVLKCNAMTETQLKVALGGLPGGSSGAELMNRSADLSATPSGAQSINWMQPGQALERTPFDDLSKDAELFFETRALRFCPLCVGEFGFHCVWHQCVLLTACPLDGCRLRSSCIQCGNRLVQCIGGKPLWATYRCKHCALPFAGSEPAPRFDVNAGVSRTLLEQVFGPWQSWLRELACARKSCAFIGDRLQRADSYFASVYSIRLQRERAYWLDQFPPPGDFLSTTMRQAAPAVLRVRVPTVTTPMQSEWHAKVFTDLRAAVAAHCSPAQLRRAREMLRNYTEAAPKDHSLWSFALVITELVFAQAEQLGRRWRLMHRNEEDYWHVEFAARVLPGANPCVNHTLWQVIPYVQLDAVVDWLSSSRPSSPVTINASRLGSPAFTSAYIYRSTRSTFIDFIVSPFLKQLLRGRTQRAVRPRRHCKNVDAFLGGSLLGQGTKAFGDALLDRSAEQAIDNF